MSKNKKSSPAEIIKICCSIGVYLYLGFFLIVYAFYFHEGYTRIATVKYTLLKNGSLIFGVVLIPLSLVHLAVYLRENRLPGKSILEKIKMYMSPTDLCVMAFAIVNGLSYLATQYKEVALWGEEGWYMGLGMQLICVAIYFLTSRYVSPAADLLSYIMEVTFLIFLWGLLNRFSVYPIQMEFSDPNFISCMGNINWLSGYWSVFFATGVIMYWISPKAEKKQEKIKVWFYGIYAVIALAFGIVEGSDSAYISLLVIFLLLLWKSFESTCKMERFLELILMISASCQVMRIVTVLAPNALNMSETLSNVALGNATLFLFAVALALRIKLMSDEKKRKTALEKYVWVRVAVIVLLCAAICIYLVMLVINTRHRGAIGSLSQQQMFFYDQSWGNGRAGTWRDAFAIFASLPIWQKFVGAGPDCFYAYGSTHEPITTLMQQQFGSQRLTNAHNECLTILANLGIFGLVSFLGLIWTAICRYMKKAAKQPVMMLFAACILSYFFHNMFSFEQVENTPFLYCILGIGEAYFCAEQRSLR